MDQMSANYKISGRVVAEERDREYVGLGKIEVTITPEKGVVIEDKNSETKTDSQGNFSVELRNSFIDGNVFVLEFTDKTGKYDNKVLSLPIQGVEFENGDGLLYMGEYGLVLKDPVKLSLKGSEEAEESIDE